MKKKLSLSNFKLTIEKDGTGYLGWQRVETTFHARYDAKSKVYQYRIWNHNLPRAIGRHYAWHIRRKLDAAAMRSAMDHIIGFRLN